MPPLDPNKSDIDFGSFNLLLLGNLLQIKKLKIVVNVECACFWYSRNGS